MIEKIISEIRSLLQQKQLVLVAIDGRCASGKTTLAGKLAERLTCNIIHMDDFFLRPEQRTVGRYDEVGGNVDRERLEEEVLLPLKVGAAFSFRPFDCHNMSFAERITVTPKDITVIEGTYSCHPMLWDYYDLHIFLNVSFEKQLCRLTERDKGSVDMFCKKWIPLEERYFSEYGIERLCEMRFET